MSASSLPALDRAVLYFTVSLTGAAVMVIELLGTRMIAPFYGVSLYVWSSLISVTMISLALGYFAGGHWADRAQRTGLSLIIAAAGLFTLMIPWVTRPVLLLSDPLGLRGGAFISALILFSPALTCLGMVGPFAIKLATAQLSRVGSSAGSVYAVSTIGSVLGTLLLGFYLFPLIGSREVLIGTGLGLLLLALCVGWYERRVFRRPAALLSSMLVSALGLLTVPYAMEAGKLATSNDDYQIRSEQESLYGWVRVFDKPKGDLRLLMSDASTIGAANISNMASRLTYQQIVPMIPEIVPGMKHALLIGLGAGHMVQMLNENHGIITDTLEIDQAVATAAADYFSFRPTGKALIGDARYEIRHLRGPYDLIIHDCFTGGTEPAHLLTVETLTQLRGLLGEHGVLALNFVGFASDTSKALASVSKTLSQVFPQQTIFISDPGREFNDFVFLASQQSLNLNAPGLPAEHAEWLSERRYTLNKEAGTVLTDNFNPLEHLQINKSEHYRSVMVEWFGANMLLR